MKVVIFAHGGVGIGGGHIARTAAFADWLVHDGRFPTPHVFWDCPAAMLKTFQSAHSFAAIAAGASDFLKAVHALTKSDSNVVIIVDALKPAASFIQSLKGSGPAALVSLNDSCGEPNAFDLVFDSDPMDLETRSNAFSKYRRGPMFAVLDRTVAALRPSEVTLKPTPQKLLIALGTVGRETSCQLKEQVCTRSPDLEVDVIPEASAGASELSLHLQPPLDYRRRLAAADMVVAQGGVTAFEAMALGVPCVLVPHPQNTAHTERLVAAGLALNAYNDGVGVSVADTLMRISQNPHKLYACAKHAFVVVDSYGALNTLKVILGHLQSHFPERFPITGQPRPQHKQ